MTEGTHQITNQMLDLLEGYLDNIAAAATQMAENGGPLAGLAASLAISVDTVAKQQQDIKRVSEQINALKIKGATVTSEATVPGGGNIVCKHCESVGQTVQHRKNSCYFVPRKQSKQKRLGKTNHEGEGSEIQ